MPGTYFCSFVYNRFHTPLIFPLVTPSSPGRELCIDTLGLDWLCHFHLTGLVHLRFLRHWPRCLWNRREGQFRTGPWPFPHGLFYVSFFKQLQTFAIDLILNLGFVRPRLHIEGRGGFYVYSNVQNVFGTSLLNYPRKRRPHVVCIKL